jgi:hypothetical protein
MSARVFRSHVIRGKDTHGTHIRPELGTRGMRGSKPGQGSAEWVGERAGLGTYLLTYLREETLTR